ncbi:hypothetical protein [Embleya sp. NBC_00896]|uniref:hypothetical protein n=1 Tax=Embleya sp. NBC_00896 TaxID=2975961 RepID=UPI00386352B8|nr:hypothetical protein OG928_03875 [Embleya sp. NBC_00896]
MDIERERAGEHPRVDDETARASADTPATTGEQTARAERWGKLPERVAPADQVEERPADPPNDPEFGRDPDNDWLLRYAP